MIADSIDGGQLIELLLGSLLLPAVVALAITHWRMNRKSIRAKRDWYDSVEAAAARIERAWYNDDELTQEKIEDTKRTVESSLDDLKEFKGNPEAGGKLVDSIEFLNRRWLHNASSIHSFNETYGTISASIQRDCRQIRYIAQRDRPKPFLYRIKRNLPRPIDWIRYCQKMGFTISRGRLSTETIEKLEMQLNEEEIKQVVEGKKTIRITHPFQSRLLLDTDSSKTHFMMNEFTKIKLEDTEFQKSFRIFPMPEQAIQKEMGMAEEWELEDLGKTRDIIFHELGMYNSE